MPAKDHMSDNQFHMHLYHGTSKSALPGIYAAGIGGNVGHTPNVYLTHDPDLADYYANNFEDPAVLKVRVNPRNLEVDWNSFDEPVYGYDDNKRKFDPAQLRDETTDWKNSLRQTGAVLHRGAVKPENIVSEE